MASSVSVSLSSPKQLWELSTWILQSAALSAPIFISYSALNSSSVFTVSAVLPSRSCIPSQTSKERITSWHRQLLTSCSGSCQPLWVEAQLPAPSHRRCYPEQHNWCSRPTQLLSSQSSTRNSCKDRQWLRRRATCALVEFLGHKWKASSHSENFCLRGKCSREAGFF